MHNNEETLQAIRLKSVEVLLKWEMIDNSVNPPTVATLNPITRVSVSCEMDIEDGKIVAFIYKIVDQTSIIRPKKAKLISYSDGDLHCEYSGFTSEEDILNSLNR